MFIKICLIVFVASSAVSRQVPRYTELDEEDQLLFRAAYDTPYEHEDHEYQEPEEPAFGKLDLLKDGMLAIKTKIKEMKIFNKALAANLLSTKLQLKELLLKNLKVLKTHHHVEVEKKPAYHYQAPQQHPPAYYYYETPHYSAPIPQYESQHYIVPAPQYEAQHYSAPQHEAPQYSAPAPQHEAPHYSAPAPQHEAPHYSASAPQYEPPKHGPTQYAPPQYGPSRYDPYYGH